MYGQLTATSPGLKRKKCKKAPPVTDLVRSQAVPANILLWAEQLQLSGSVIYPPLK